MFISGKAQRRGAQSTQLGTSSRNVQSSKISIPKTSALPASDKSSTTKKRKHATIGNDSASGLLIQGSSEINLYKGSNPDDVEPPLSGNSLRLPDFPISYSGRGIPKFVSPIRISSVDESLSIGNNLNVTGNTTIDGSLTVAGSSLDPSNYMKTDADNDPVTGLQRFTNTTDSLSTTTGAVTVSGGMGVKLNAYFGQSIDVDLNAGVGGGLGVAGQVLSTSVDNSTTINSGAIVTSGGLGVAQDANIGGGLNVGGVVVATTGVGSSGQIVTTSTANSTSVATGGIVSDGGLGVAKDVHIGGDTYHEGSIKLLGSTSGTATIAAAAVTTDHTLTLPDAVGLDGQLLALDPSGSPGDLKWMENFNSTGVINGGVLSVGTPDTTYSVTDGHGHISVGGVLSEATWSGITNTSITDPAPLQPGDSPSSLLSTRILTFVSIDSAGNAIVSANKPSFTKQREYIYLGVLIHVNGVNVNTVNNQQAVLENTTNGFRDLCDILGFINVSGNNLGYTGTLNITKSDGTMFAYGANYPVDTSNPHVVTLPAIDTSTTGTFQIRFQDGTSSALTLTSFIVDMLDDGNPYPGTTLTNNYYTVWRAYGFTSNALKFQAPQFEYSSESDAIANINVEAYIKEPSLNNGILIGYIVVREGSTLTTASFLSAPTLGGGGISGSGSIPSMQTTYNNSVSPQLLLTSALGGIRIKDAATPIGVSLFSVGNSAGGNVFNVTATSVVTNQDFSANAKVITDTVDSSGAGTDITLGSNVTTGAVRLGAAQTSGNVNIGNLSATSGKIRFLSEIGTDVDVGAGFKLVTNTVESRANNTSLYVGGNVTTANVRIGDTLSGRADSATGDGKVTIGDSSGPHLEIFHHNINDSINLRVDNGVGDADLVIRGTAGSLMDFGSSVTTGTVSIAPSITTGVVDIGTTQTEANITIGNASATTGEIVLQSSNFTSDSYSTGFTDDTGTTFAGVTGLTYWERMGNLVFLQGEVAWTGKGSTSAGSKVRITGFSNVASGVTAFSSGKEQVIHIAGKTTTALVNTGRYDIPHLEMDGGTNFFYWALNYWAAGGSQEYTQAVVSDFGAAGSFRYSGVIRID